MNYNTIDTIIDDIMLEIKKNNISEYNMYSERQIEQWIIQYRSAIISAKLSKGEPLSMNYYQQFKLELSQAIDVEIGDNAITIAKTNESIPNACLTGTGNRLISIYDNFGNEIQLMSMRRSKLNKSRRYFDENRLTAYIDDIGRVCVDNNDFLGDIVIRMVAIDPSSVPGFSHSESMYPIEPGDMTEIKRLIFVNELRANTAVEEVQQYSKNRQ